jgi:hypothetical protein
VLQLGFTLLSETKRIATEKIREAVKDMDKEKESDKVKVEEK